MIQGCNCDNIINVSPTLCGTTTKLPVTAYETGTWSFQTEINGVIITKSFPVTLGQLVELPIELNPTTNYQIAIRDTANKLVNNSCYYVGSHCPSKGASNGIAAETDPIFGASVAASITAANVTNWNGYPNAIATSITNHKAEPDPHAQYQMDGNVIDNGRVITVDPTNPNATDTARNGVSKYSTDKPFMNYGWAFLSSTLGDTIVIQNATVGAITVAPASQAIRVIFDNCIVNGDLREFEYIEFRNKCVWTGRYKNNSTLSKLTIKADNTCVWDCNYTCQFTLSNTYALVIEGFGEINGTTANDLFLLSVVIGNGEVPNAINRPPYGIVRNITRITSAGALVIGGGLNFEDIAYINVTAPVLLKFIIAYNSGDIVFRDVKKFDISGQLNNSNSSSARFENCNVNFMKSDGSPFVANGYSHYWFKGGSVRFNVPTPNAIMAKSDNNATYIIFDSVAIYNSSPSVPLVRLSNGSLKALIVRACWGNLSALLDTQGGAMGGDLLTDYATVSIMPIQ